MRRGGVKFRGAIIAAAVFLGLWIVGGGIAFAAEQDQTVGKGISDKNKESATEKVVLVPVHFYQKYLSPVIGGQCPMYPSCSNYCVHAVKKHGPVMGWIMACDRLMRCGRDEVKRAPVVHRNQSAFTYDPVEANDFWRK